MLISEILFASRYYNFNFRMDKVFTQDIHKTKTLNEFLGLKKTYWIIFFYLHTHTNTHPKEPQILLLPSLSSPASIPFLSLLSLCSCCLYTFSSSHSILNPLYLGICLYHFRIWTCWGHQWGSNKYLAKSKGWFSCFTYLVYGQHLPLLSTSFSWKHVCSLSSRITHTFFKNPHHWLLPFLLLLLHYLTY